MLKNQCISVTELRLNTKKHLEDLQKADLKHKEKFIFVNNKPVAVLMDIELYEKRAINTSFSSKNSTTSNSMHFSPDIAKKHKKRSHVSYE